MSLLYEVCMAGGRGSALRHLDVLSGIEHLPVTGPFILVGKHSSFYDHPVVELAHYLVRGRPLYFLTKKESFRRASLARWHAAMHSLPIDRDRPDASSIKALDDALAGGGALCIYPEGTRHPEGMLPFKPGAMWLALRAGVPIVPFAVSGSQVVLPSGAWMPRKGRVNVSFGPAVDVSFTAGRRRERLNIAVQNAEHAVRELHREAGLATPGGATAAATALCETADRLMNEGLGQDARPEMSRAVRARIRELLNLARRADPGCERLPVLQLRFLGLRALASPAPLRMWRGISALATAETVVREVPRDALARYVLGKALLTAPTFGGGDRERGRAELEEAVRLQPGDARFVVALAEACAGAGDHARAHELAGRAMTIEQEDLRADRRRGRARRLLGDDAQDAHTSASMS